MLVELTKGPSDSVHAYVLEYQGKDSALVKVEFSSDLLGGLRAITLGDY